MQEVYSKSPTTRPRARFTTGKRFLRDHDLFQEKFDVFHSNFALSELPRKIQKP